MIRVAILGRGLAGSTFHAPLIGALPEFHLVAVAGSTDVPSLITDPAIDLVVVATPDATHFELAAAALHSGKHVVVEKPVTTSSEQAAELIRLAAEQGKQLIPFHNRRWDGDFLTVQQVMNSGRLGEIRLYESYWDRFRPQVPHTWRETPGAGAGTLWNLGPHLIDQMLVLFGRPQTIQGDLESQRAGAKAVDYFALSFEYGAMRAIVGCSNLIADPRPRFALHGTQGSFVKFGLDPQEGQLKSGLDPKASVFGQSAATEDGKMTSSTGAVEQISTQPGQYLAFYRQVAATIEGKAPPPVDAHDAVAGIRIIECAIESRAENRRLLFDIPKG